LNSLAALKPERIELYPIDKKKPSIAMTISLSNTTNKSSDCLTTSIRAIGSPLSVTVAI
jgi:hypothetical protein